MFEYIITAKPATGGTPMARPGTSAAKQYFIRFEEVIIAVVVRFRLVLWAAGLSS